MAETTRMRHDLSYGPVPSHTHIIMLNVEEARITNASEQVPLGILRMDTSCAELGKQF